ncbi:MAG: hypothetical protein QOF06_2634 [Solirubrobacterales bacterium]|jgi:hypothetical protein|nr:hypothetical protein [Solirubrobacterales bacterium]
MGDSCAICGRTILAGERVHGYLDGGEEERTVCELCVERAERLAWCSASESGVERPGRDHEGRGRLRGLLRRRHRRPGALATPVPAPASPDPAGSARRARPLPAPDDFAPTPFERAVARFNSSEAGHTVTGLTRTLGVPRASVGASAGAPGEVRITVAWELSWYQWGVDVGDELRAVFELGKGGEIDQLDAAARQWNAIVAEDGKLRLAGDPAPSR